MTAFPTATAILICASGTIIGKLNGEIAATTPSGYFAEYALIFPPTLTEYSPFTKCGAPIAKSTDSIPRVTSPFASSIVFPLSRQIIAKSSSKCCVNKLRKFNKTCARFATETSRHAGNAACASAMASRVSSLVASGTFAMTSPVVGLKTSPNRPLCPSTFCPPIKCVNV